MHGRRLLLCFGVSLLIHFLLGLLIFFLDLQLSSSNRPMSASLRAVLKPVGLQDFQLTEDRSLFKSLPATGGEPDPKISPKVSDRFGGGQSVRGIYEANELDDGIRPLLDPSIEPEYGFSDDLVGTLDISVLISPDGKPVLVWHEPSDLDEAAIIYISNALRVTQFSPPKKNGFPVYGIFRIQVEVGAGAGRRKN